MQKKITGPCLMIILKIVCGFSLILVSNAFAQQATQSPAIVLNNSNGPIDYHVILTDGSSQYLNSIEPGFQVTENFYTGEQILITPKGSQQVIANHIYDGTVNAVLAAVPNPATLATPATPPTKSAPVAVQQSAPISAAPPQTATAAQTQAAPAAAPKREEKPTYKPSPQFLRWVNADKPYYEQRSDNDTTYQAGFQEKFRMEDQMRKGYNIIKMDPSKLTNRGLRGNAPDIIKKLAGSSHKWGIRELGLAMPNDLVLLPENARTRGVEQTTVMFSSDQERKSTSTNVGVSLDAKKGGGSGKIGVSREESKFESNNQSMIRKQIVGEAYWVVYAKEHMELAKGFSKFLKKQGNLRNYSDFKRMFQQYGTHWPIATLFGGYIRYDEKFDTKEMAESITKTLSVDFSAKAPVPKAPSATVGTNVGFTQSDTNEMKSKESSGKASFESQGGQPGASFSMWNMATPTQADNYVPLKVELRGIDELIWPELMGITDPKEAQRIHALRLKTGQMLQRYIDEVNGVNDNYDWSPRIYEVSITRAVVSQDDDEGSANEPDFFGSLILSEAKKLSEIKIGSLTIPTYDHKTSTNKYVWSKSRGDSVTKGKGSTFKLRSNPAIYISVPATAVKAGTVNGKPIYKPEFRTKDIVGHFKSTMKDSDNTGDDESVSGSFAISLDEVEKDSDKLVKVTKEFSDEGVGIKVTGQVKRMNYELQNSDFELLPLPGLSNPGQGARIASEPISNVSLVSASGGSSNLSSSSSAEQVCFNLVQGKVPWSVGGSKSWAAGNVRSLCSGVSAGQEQARVNCFNSLMPSKGWDSAIKTCKNGSSSASAEQACYKLVQGKVPWSVGGSVSWADGNVKSLCRGVSAGSEQKRVNCFSSWMPSLGWQAAINKCS